ncbi:magnesium/cobalt transporter CorA [Planctomicrobium sp. SH664]|uniref:magnesium/cobalt transporter CorA n=1 Tax=Planctomicrobium sp. SH664 TaxID=3448125 RepID=UPI003F5BCB24
MPQSWKKVRRKLFHRRTPPGTAPGTLVPDTTKQPSQLHYTLFGPTTFQEQDVDSLAEVPQPERDEVLWLEVVGLGDSQTVEAVGKRFKLHSLALEDVLHVHQRAKTEEYDQTLFVIARMLTSHEPVTSEQISLFLGSNFVITFDERPGDCFNGVRNRLRQNGVVRSHGADYLLYCLLDSIIDDYFPRMEHFGSQIDNLDEIITRARDRSVLILLHEIRRDLIQIRKLLWQHREALNSLVRLEIPLISRETQVYLRDCLDHVVQLIEVVEADRDSCISMQELYLSEIGQRTNDVMKVLTLIATLFMPMTFVAGVYGMNFDPAVSPWNMPELKWYYGYPFALAIMGVLGFGMSLFFWLRGWFRR